MVEIIMGITALIVTATFFIALISATMEIARLIYRYIFNGTKPWENWVLYLIISYGITAGGIIFYALMKVFWT